MDHPAKTNRPEGHPNDRKHSKTRDDLQCVLRQRLCSKPLVLVVARSSFLVAVVGAGVGAGMGARVGCRSLVP